MAAIAGVCVALLPAFGLTPTTALPQASAASGADFNAGNIISDEQFYSPNAMSVGSIQAFLNQRVPTCRAGYTCLKDFSQYTVAKAPDRYCAGFGVNYFSAAEIIEGVGRSCGVSAKVMLVLLDKEQALVSDSWPTDRQYRSATGYGCPDTADCDATYYGFFNQVYYAARQFKYYQANPTNWRYQAGRSNYIQWNPNAGCGGSNVYIQNQATAGLYIYTPYQPNAAALANMYGTGDGCSAYGNRNFWRIYTDWFGPTVAFPVSGGIGEYYIARGGSSGSLGSPVGEQYLVDASRAGWKQAFRNGSIYWSPATGGRTVSGGIGLEYERLGGPSGTGLGFATGEQSALGDVAGGWQQTFETGRIYWTPATGAIVVGGGIGLDYVALGGPLTSGLGYPTGAQASSDGGWWQPFQNGTIYWTPFTGSVVVRSEMRGQLDALGGPVGSGLGFPTARETTSGANRSQTFQNGSLYYSPATGGWTVSGGIGIDYLSWGGPTGSGLGLPTGRQRPIGSGWTQTFQNGTVYWSPSAGARTVPGGIGILYENLGGPQGSGLGYPVGAQTNNGSSWSQLFEYGRIDFTAASGAVATITNAQRAAYYAAGGPLGPLGAAVSARSGVGGTNGGWVERYAGGSLYGSAATASHRVSGGIGLAYEAAGGPVSSQLGFPTAESYPLGDAIGGWIQRFENGAIYWSPSTQGQIVTGGLAKGFDRSGGPTGGTAGYPASGTRTVGGVTVQSFSYGPALYSEASGYWDIPGAIGATWERQGGVTGTLGLPISVQASGIQRFAGGTVYWSGATGPQITSGGIGLLFSAMGGPGGTGIGYPVASAVELEAGWVQVFQSGRIYWTPSSGAVVTSGGIGESYVARSGHYSGVGYPVGPQYPMGDGGWSQRFDSGALYWSPSTGTRYGVGGLGETFAARGGPSGSGLGYPLTDQTNLGGGNWAQYFQRGRIDWRASSGPAIVRY